MRASRLTPTFILVLGVLATPGLALLAARPPASLPEPIFIAGDRTQAAFATGQPLVETSAYKVHASRREAPGMAEVHTLDTDILYVLEGSATIVTGGRVVSAAEIGPHEVRGASIDGGTTRRLAKGDLLIVPNGVPHWFKDVQPPFLYYVVKSTAAATGVTGGAE
jgi:mannose-6-phosphate isomerase-like protein (cupin superfamily)